MTSSARRGHGARRPTGLVRIIGGRWKRSVLPVADAPGLRPTPDRVRESLFNWLTHAFGTLEGRSALDLFAGSGALGFEAASRGATPVVLVERDRQIAARLGTVRERLDAHAIEIRTGDGLEVAARLLREGRRFDVVFVDPPFASGLRDQALPLASALCSPDGLVYVESDAAVDGSIAAAHALEPYRADKAGGVFYHLLQRKKTAV